MYYNVVAEMGSAKHFWSKPKNYVTHAMRLKDTRMMGPLAVIIMIHKGTHKYAGTNDYCYFEEDGSAPGGEFKSKTKALENADSYAYFAVNVGA